MKNEKLPLKVVGKSLAVCTLLLLVGAAATIGQSLVDYELTVNTDQETYYPDENVIVSGSLTKEGQGVPEGVIYLRFYNDGGALIAEEKTMTNSQGDYTVTVALPGVEPGICSIVATVENPYVKAEATFEVVSTTIVADPHGPYEGITGQPVQFSGDATGGKAPYTWLWDFDDGNTSTQQNPTHAFAAPRQYNVTLTATDTGGYHGSDIAKATITAAPNSPPNKPTITGPTSGVVGEEYEYTVVTTDPDGDDVCYYVDWGDGTNSEWTSLFASGVPAVVKHTWDESGTFVVKVKARDVYTTESIWSDPLTVEISSPPPTLNVSLQGGYGVKFIITNTGDVEAQNVSYSVSVEGGLILLRPKEPVTGTTDIPAGAEEIVKVPVFGIGKVEITGKASLPGEYIAEITKTAFVLGFFVIIR